MTFHYAKLVIWAASVEVDPDEFAGIHNLSCITFVTPGLASDTLDVVDLDSVDKALSAPRNFRVVMVVPPAIEASADLEMPRPPEGELKARLEGDIRRTMANLQSAERLKVEFSQGPGIPHNSWNSFLISD